MITIGQALKSLRLHAGLTQSEMAAGLISTSFYSKTERDVHAIDANTLVDILSIHHFDVVDFFSKIVNQDQNRANPFYKIQSDIVFAKNTKDLNKLDKIKRRIEKYKQEANTPEIPDSLIFKLELAYAWVLHSNDQVAPELRSKIKSMVVNENWDRTSYYFLSQAVILLNIDEAYALVTSAFSAFKKHPATDPFSLQFVSWIAVNYLNCCFHKNADIKYTKCAVDFLRQLPTTPEIGFSCILGTYYEALFNKDQQTIDAIILILKKSKYFSLIEDTVKK